MYLLTDGKNYVMRNPMDAMKYISTTSPVMATQFTYKEARTLIQNKKAATRWIKQYHMVECETNETVECDPKSVSRKDLFVTDEYNSDVIAEVITEKNNILGLAGWSSVQLETYRAILNNNQSYCDCALSDIRHAINDIDKIPAHTRAKIVGYEKDILSKRAKTKECIRYIDTMITAIKNNYTLEKLKLEISKVEPEQYKGRTKYYNFIKELIK